jgi:Ribonuclease G/E
LKPREKLQGLSKKEPLEKNQELKKINEDLIEENTWLKQKLATVIAQNLASLKEKECEKEIDKIEKEWNEIKKKQKKF